MADRLRLALSVTLPNGRVVRWGGDEPDASEVPDGLRFSTAIPGGFRELSVNLPRDIGGEFADLNLLHPLRCYGPGPRTAWAGRLSSAPRDDSGSGPLISISAVGHAAHLDDDNSFREIYVDRDLGGWGSVPAARNASVKPTASDVHYKFASSGVEGDPGNTYLPAFYQRFSEVDTDTAGTPKRLDIAEAWYVGAAPIGKIYLDLLTYNRDATTPFEADPAFWTSALYFSTYDVATDVDGFTALESGDAGFFEPTTADRRYAFLQFFHPAAYTDTAIDVQARWRKLTVYGLHGLPLYGTTPGSPYASDIVADVVARTAPLLRFTTGPGGSIEPIPVEIPHLVFATPTTGHAVIDEANSYVLAEYGCYGEDGRNFFYRVPDPARRTWLLRREGEGANAKVKLDGPDADACHNGVIVSFSEPGGTRRMIGPPGSGGDAEYASLADADPENPVNAAGIPRKWPILDVSKTTTIAAARVLGEAWMKQNANPAFRGQATVTGTARILGGAGDWPSWEIRAGDFCMLEDGPNATLPRRIMTTEYSDDSGENTLSLDNTSNQLDAIMEAMGASLVGVA